MSCQIFAAGSGEIAAKRVYTHLLIDDSASALKEAKEQLIAYPESKALRLALIKALCSSGKEIEALEEWKAVVEKHEDLLQDRRALETLAWGVLNKGESSNQLIIKLNALLGASMTRDAKAIPLILQGLRGSNSLMRSMAVGLAAAYGDLPLQDEIARLLKEEKVWYVRLELLKAAGQLRMTHIKDEFKRIIGHRSTLAEEKVMAIVSLVNMYEHVEDEELDNLIKSNRSGLRELSCEIISHLNLHSKVEKLIPLLNDSHPHVRMSALNALALLRIKELQGEPIMQHKSVARLLADHVPEVAITASYLALINQDKRAEKHLTKWILQKDEKYARLASGALAISGKFGAKLAQDLLKKTFDPYIQINLSLGLIGQRENVDLSCELIDKHLKVKELLMWDNSLNPLIRSIAPSKVRHNQQIPNYPNVIDQLTRIELLNILCMMNYPKSLDAMKGFLTQQTWGATGAAASTLLQEGDDGALDIVRELLSDPSKNVRIQAALILALLGGDKAAVAVLKDAYPTASREIKLHILEALAKIGDPETMSFLLDRLNEPFQVLRVVAATAIIQCLYH